MCSNGRLQSWETRGAQSGLPADGVFWDLTLCLWLRDSRRFVDAGYQSKRPGTAHRTTQRHIAEGLNTYIAHCASCC